MTYEQVNSLKSGDFTAMCGVRPDTNNCDGRGSAISLTAWQLKVFTNYIAIVAFPRKSLEEVS
ncbi:hypothetical protein [Nostoc sp.]|uniref:hypothetical protein n=1 Tax=Nostoc sp. TaxID=1180 RepID=UPI002FF930DB